MSVILQDLIDRVSEAVNSDSVGVEICNRIKARTPLNKEQASLILDSFDLTLNKEITDRIVLSLSHYDHGECGIELADSINGIASVLQAFVNGQSLERVRTRVDAEVMSKITLEALALALKGVGPAKDFKKSYDLMVSAIHNTGKNTSEEEIVAIGAVASKAAEDLTEVPIQSKSQI